MPASKMQRKRPANNAFLVTRNYEGKELVRVPVCVLGYVDTGIVWQGETGGVDLHPYGEKFNKWLHAKDARKTSIEVEAELTGVSLSRLMATNGSGSGPALMSVLGVRWDHEAKRLILSLGNMR